MNENIYLPKKETRSSGNNILQILGAIIIILILIFGILALVKNINSGQTDNSIVTVTPTITADISEAPITHSPSPSPSPTLTPILNLTPSITPTGTPVKIYFYKSPIKPNQDTNEIYSVDRYTLETNLIPFAIKEYFKGPTADEATAGYINPYTLTGDSNCGGSSYKFSYNMPTLKLTICKQIEPTPESGDGGSYAGSGLKAMSRVLKVITTSLKVGGITKVEVYDKTGACYAPETGLNSCTL
jgi:hypothetical protein